MQHSQVKFNCLVLANGLVKNLKLNKNAFSSVWNYYWLHHETSVDGYRRVIAWFNNSTEADVDFADGIPWVTCQQRSKESSIIKKKLIICYEKTPDKFNKNSSNSWFKYYFRMEKNTSESISHYLGSNVQAIGNVQKRTRPQIDKGTPVHQNKQGLVIKNLQGNLKIKLQNFSSDVTLVVPLPHHKLWRPSGNSKSSTPQSLQVALQHAKLRDHGGGSRITMPQAMLVTPQHAEPWEWGSKGGTVMPQTLATTTQPPETHEQDSSGGLTMPQDLPAMLWHPTLQPAGARSQGEEKNPVPVWMHFISVGWHQFASRGSGAEIKAPCSRPMWGLEGSPRQPRAGSSQSGDCEEDSWWQPLNGELTPWTDSAESVHLSEEKTWKSGCGECREDSGRPTRQSRSDNW